MECDGNKMIQCKNVILDQNETILTYMQTYQKKIDLQQYKNA